MVETHDAPNNTVFGNDTKQSIYACALMAGDVLIPEGAVLSFVQAGEAAVQTGDLTVGDWREDAEEFTTDELKITAPHSKTKLLS